MSQTARIHRDYERGVRPYSCGGCGRTFSNKSAKRRHKEECDREAFDYPPPYISPEIKAQAAAEWDAMPQPMTAVHHARAHLARMAPERWGRLQKEWSDGRTS